MASIMLICYAGGYTVVPPYYSSKEEILDCQKGIWSPSDFDFYWMAQNSSAPVQWKIDSLRSLLDVINSYPASFIKRLVLIGHANSHGLSFAGTIDRNRKNVFFTDQLALISESTIKSQWVQDYVLRNHLWDRFAAYGEIILVGCNTGGGRPPAFSVEGEGSGLTQALYDTFKADVLSFKRGVTVFLGYFGTNFISKRGEVGYDPNRSRATKPLPGGLDELIEKADVRCNR